MGDTHTQPEVARPQRPRIPWSAALHRLGVPHTVRAGGRRWRLDRRIIPRTAHKVRVGTYEAAERAAALTLFDRDLPILEIGAGIGTTSVHLNHALRPIWHRVLDCNPESLRLVEQQKRLNDCTFHTVLGGLGYPARSIRVPGRARHVRTGWSLTDHGSEDGDIEVTVAGLDKWAPPGPYNLLIDAEGMEYDMIQHDADHLASRVASLVVDWTPRRDAMHRIPPAAMALMDMAFEWRWSHGNVSGYVKRELVPHG